MAQQRINPMWSIVRVVTIYALFGFAWILYSDAVVLQLFGNNPNTLSYIQSIKGNLYVFVTALLLGIVLYYELRRYQKKEDDFQQLFLNNPQPMWIYDAETFAFLEVNTAAVTKYGYSRDEFLHMTIKDIRPEDELPRLEEALSQEQAILQNSEDWRHRSKTGKIFIVKIISHHLDYFGRAARLVTAIDVTERRRLENHRLENQTLRVELQQEKERQKGRSRFISMVSHEFRNPLAVISTSVGIMQQLGDKLETERREKHLSKIAVQIKRLLELLDEMLAILRMEAASANFKPESCDMVQLCQQLIESLPASYNYQGKIELQCSEPSISAQVDMKLMQRIMENLLGNAMKYSPDGEKIILNLQKLGEELQITVKDDGIGIPESSLENVFDPFFRADNTGRIQGTGLGLAIVKQGAELHGGEVSVKSKVGEGSEFILSLPLHAQYVDDLEKLAQV